MRLFVDADGRRKAVRVDQEDTAPPSGPEKLFPCGIKALHDPEESIVEYVHMPNCPDIPS